MTRAGHAIAIVFVLACSVGGCPASSGGPIDGSGDQGSAGDPCDEWKTWKLRCTPDASAADLHYYDNCKALHWNKFKPALISAMSECFPALSCDESDDVCALKGYAAIGLHGDDVSSDPLVLDCLDTIASCDVSDDACVDLATLIDSARAEAKACSGLACDAHSACLDNVFGIPPQDDTP